MHASGKYSDKVTLTSSTNLLTAQCHTMQYKHVCMLVSTSIDHADNPSSDHSKSRPPKVEYKVRAAVRHHSWGEGCQGGSPGR